MLLEETVTAKDLCSRVLPTASIACIPTFSSAASLIRATVPDATKPAPSIFSSFTLELASHFFSNTTPLAGIDLYCSSTDPPEQLNWLHSALSMITTLATSQPPSAFLLSIPLSTIEVNTDHLTQALTSRFTASPWSLRCGATSASFFGDAVYAPRWIAYGLDPCRSQASTPVFPPTMQPPPFTSRIDPLGNTLDNTLFNLPRLPPPPLNPTPHLPLPLCTMSTQSNPSRSIVIYDPDFPIPESDPNLLNTFFFDSFAIAFPNNFNSLAVRAASASEVLALFSFPPDISSALPPYLLHAAAPLCFSSLPFSTAKQFAQQLFINGILPDTTCPRSMLENSVHCLAFTARAPPSTAEWTTAHKADPDTQLLLSHLSTPAPVPPTDLSKLHASYRRLLQTNNIFLSNDRLITYQDLPAENHRLLLIIVPHSLRRTIFAAYHASPSTGHFGPYKTLHRVRQRFFWPRVTSDIHAWCKECASCILTRNTIRKSSELSFSWPISTPFYILHVDLWEPGRVKCNKLRMHQSTHLLVAMCDLTGFIICEDLANPTAETLSTLFMKSFPLKVGLCGLVVVDDDSKFKSHFVTMCRTLNIRHHCIAKRNHQALSVERFFRVLNKTVTIAANDRKVPPSHVFIETAQCTAYAWNSSPIDGTDILRSVAALGREFKFPFDLSLETPPTPEFGNVAAVHNFLRLAQDQSHFSTEILKILTADRRAYHQERVNASRNQVLFKVGDYVSARVTVQSNATENRVAKLSYRVKPFVIVDTTEHGAYICRPAHQPDGATRRFHAQDLSLLPPVIRPTEPIDGADLRYSNTRHAPVHHPFRSHFNIKLYNETWLSKPSDSQPPPVSSSASLPPLEDDSCTATTGFDTSDSPILRVPNDGSVTIPKVPTSAPALLHAIHESTDRLFFICYRPTDTLRARWYLVSVDLAQSERASDCLPLNTTGKFYVHFYARHPNDSSEPDSTARWWPEWHEYSTSTDGTIDYGKRALIYPTTTPNARKYIAWADVVDLCNPSTTLFGPFNFQDPTLNPPGRSSSYRQYVPLSIWESLFHLCTARGVQPPILSMPEPSPTPTERTKRKRKARQDPSNTS